MTRHLPGTFAFRKETIMACIEEYLENLDRFGFKRVVFFNDHGDGLHISAIVESIKNANRKLELQAYWMEYKYELKEHGFSGEEDYILKLTDMPFEEMFQISKWCNGAAEDKALIPNGYVGDPKGSQYIVTNLKEADRRIANVRFTE